MSNFSYYYANFLICKIILKKICHIKLDFGKMCGISQDLRPSPPFNESIFSLLWKSNKVKVFIKMVF